MRSKSKVCFFFEKRGFTLRDRNRLKKFIEFLFRKENTPLSSINYIFCSDKRLLDINREFLRHDFYTDIVTFDLAEKGPVRAEVYISVDRVRDNAKKLGLSFKSELHRVVFHGVLHLCGYRDKTSLERREIREKEEYYINQYFR